MPNLQYCRPKGRPRLTLTEDNRLRVTRFFEVRAENLEPAVLQSRVFDAYLTADSKYTDCVLVDQFTSPAADQTVEVTLTQVFEQITGTETRVGSIQVRAAGGHTYVNTTAAGLIQASTKFAREWVANYVVTGDAAAGSTTNWLNVNTTLVLGTGPTATTGYLTGCSVIARASGYALIARTFTELPSKFVYGQRGQYTFPAKLGYSSDLGPYISEPSATREVEFSIEETYHTSEPAADSLDYEPIYWARGVVNYTRATGEEGAKAFNFPGAIGSITVSMSNRVFAGYLCSSVSGTVASSPSTYPSGEKRISSKIYQWKGALWMKRNTSLTFP